MILTLVNVLGATISILVVTALALGGPMVDLHEHVPMCRPAQPQGTSVPASIPTVPSAVSAGTNAAVSR